MQIDIIIPVYRGAAETRACIESVLASKNIHPVEIVIVDDASPEPAIVEYLTSLADAGRITLLHNESNRGFVASVNSGMSLHGDRDVILLNSDTEVADGWVDRLAAFASARKDAASISPFSNNATLCSYPRIGRANALPSNMNLGAVDRLFSTVNAGKAVEVPTTVGFCMYLRRNVLNEIGLFDVEAFQRGYGEEKRLVSTRGQKWAHTFVVRRHVCFPSRGSVVRAVCTKRQIQGAVDHR